MLSFLKKITGLACLAMISLTASAERIVFVGDSITGQGQLNSNGWGKTVRKALEATASGKSEDIVLVGGSGHSVGTWLAMVQNSKDKNFSLDAKNIDVKNEFDKGADTLVIMLGMNDVIAPYTDNTPKALAAWVERYQKLIDALKERTKAGRIGLATITMQTEDLGSYKNKLIDAMNAEIVKLAESNKCFVLPVAEEYRTVFQKGRRFHSDFHITGDYVHPSKFGHLAIAAGMLEGLDKKDAAKNVRAEYDAELARSAANIPEVSIVLLPDNSSSAENIQKFKLTVNSLNPEQEIKVSVPEKWTVSPAQLKGSGTFTLSGMPEKITTFIEVNIVADGKSHSRKITINAPWLICWGIIQPRWEYRQKLNIEKSLTPIDKAIDAGTDFLNSPAKDEGKIPEWTPYFPSFNYTGYADPGSVDFAAVCNENPYDAAYGVRWVYSPVDRKIMLKMQSKIFAGDIFMTVWLNRKKAYQDELTAQKGKEQTVAAELKKGWNELVFKSNHRAWQWQNSITIQAVPGDNIDDLRYTVKNPLINNR